MAEMKKNQSWKIVRFPKLHDERRGGTKTRACASDSLGDVASILGSVAFVLQLSNREQSRGLKVGHFNNFESHDARH
jgi:hypothetical protein